MSEAKLLKFIYDIEKIRDGHIFEYELCKSERTELASKIGDMHYNKYKAYDFVIRKLKRTFNLTNNGKEANT